MTVVTKYMNTKPEGRQDAKVWNSSGTYYWAQQDAGAIDFVVNEYYVARFFLDVPAGATITLAQFLFEYTQKDATVAQTANFSLYFEQVDNSAPWPYVTDTSLGFAGIFPRTLSTSQTFVVSYPGGSTPGADTVTQTVTSQIQALVNRPGWEAGSYITLVMLCTAEGSGSNMALQAREGASSPTIKVTYTYDDETVPRVGVNLLGNQTMANTNDVFNNSFYGLTMDGTTYAILPLNSRDGSACLQVTAHPPAGQENRFCSAVQVYDGMANETYTLSGWFYNPNPAPFSCEFPFQGGRQDYIQKNIWTPFSTLPFTVPAGGVALWCTCSIIGTASVPVTEGQWFLLDDVCLTKTDVMEMPFTGATVSKYNADYAAKETTAHGVSVRRSRARTHVILSGVSRARRHYVRNDQDMWVRAEPQRTGTWDVYDSSTWDSVSAAVTWDSLG